MKSYTDIEQSKKLAEILPPETADMHYKVNRHNNEFKIFMIPYSELGYHKDNDYQHSVCAWSVAALLSVLPNYKLSNEHNKHTCTVETSFGKETVAWFDDSVDACVEMIIKLHEKSLL